MMFSCEFTVKFISLNDYGFESNWIFFSLLFRISFAIREIPAIDKNYRLSKAHTSIVARKWREPAAQFVLTLGVTQLSIVAPSRFV